MGSLIFILCLYMVYSNVQELMAIPLPKWELPQFLLAFVTLLLLGVAVYYALRMYREWQQRKEPTEFLDTPDLPGEVDDENEEDEEEEEDELSYLHELDDEDDARRGQQ